ncbi:Uncharacterized protein SAPIO_CDS2795 [Scedosporium apiospermum]|uniref:Protein root UVB sensitive/RUS domain-containing protein n=1 Tax=Pseudallescheria apiosperma TaxID=563466 RepID=A0A084GBJ8_PSEDA|nr:Uncharacterized protein SAPIO_CDS2795 [Scedosporium apiospermum]KEZ44710.1 Uncharacterized protein SAPIO_CDS2795 [Scedosporium apiospermum]
MARKKRSKAKKANNAVVPEVQGNVQPITRLGDPGNHEEPVKEIQDMRPIDEPVKDLEATADDTTPALNEPESELRALARDTLGLRDAESDAEISANAKSLDIMELDRAGILQREWVDANTDVLKVETPAPPSNMVRKSIRPWIEWCQQTLREGLLPVGYPYSVSEDYLAYQTYDSLQAFFSTITSMLSDRALLEGLGVGDANTSTTYALLLNVFKDCVSRLATIGFAQQYGLIIEPECKRYRFMADLLNDGAFFLNLGSPLLGPIGKPILLAVAEGLRAMCGVAGNASKAALSSHFALQDNLAELNAKEASQETAVGLVGLIAGTLVVKLVQDRTAVFFLMVALVLGHLYVNYLGVRAVTLRTLNRQRATIIFSHWMRHSSVLSPAEVSERENILTWSPIISNFTGRKKAIVLFAKNYYEFKDGGHPDIWFLQRPTFLITVRYIEKSGLFRVKIMLTYRAEPIDAVKAWFLAMEMIWDLPADGKLMDYEGWELAVPNVDPDVETDVDTDDGAESEYSNHILNFNHPLLFKKLEAAGWDLGTSSMETGNPVRIKITRRKGNETKKDQ